MAVIMSKQLKVPSAPVKGVLGSDMEIGSSIFLKVNGSLREFLIVHQGNPDVSSYTSSGEGTWLLMKEIYEKRAWHTSTGVYNYSESSIHSYLNSTFLGMLDTNVQEHIKTVKLPYTIGEDPYAYVNSGSNGVSAKVFLLSQEEIDCYTQYVEHEGATLDYFKGASNSNWIAYYNGTADRWWLRSTDTLYGSGAWNLNSSGVPAGHSFTNVYGVRPALILPSNALFNPDTGEFLGVA